MSRDEKSKILPFGNYGIVEILRIILLEKLRIFQTVIYYRFWITKDAIKIQFFHLNPIVVMSCAS